MNKEETDLLKSSSKTNSNQQLERLVNLVDHRAHEKRFETAHILALISTEVIVSVAKAKLSHSACRVMHDSWVPHEDHFMQMIMVMGYFKSSNCTHLVINYSIISLQEQPQMANEQYNYQVNA